MLLMQQPALLLLDEPAAGMTDDETMELAELLNHLRGTCSMMVVEHDMEFVAALVGQDRQGHGDGRRTRARARHARRRRKRDETVIESYLGR